MTRAHVPAVGSAGTSVVLGISSGFHDAAAALVVEGTLVAAVEQERLSRRKHDPSFPELAIDACLAIAGLEAADVELVALHEKPIEVVNRHLASRIRSGPRGLPALLSTTPGVLADQLGVMSQVHRYFRLRSSPVPPLRFAQHHVSHAAAAFFPSPFDRAAVLTLDGVGEWATASIGVGSGSTLRLERVLRYPDSLGLLYTAMATYCGFRANSGEGELMGLAALGEPTYAPALLERVVEVRPDGAVRLDQRYFAYLHGRHTTSAAFHELFGGEPRPLGAMPTRREADLAASVQVVLELALGRLAHEATRRAGCGQLCMAGGVALNCAANGSLGPDIGVDAIWVAPAPGDSGSAIGAALWAWHRLLGAPRRPQVPDGMAGAFLGPSFDDDRIAGWLRSEGVPHRRIDDQESLRAEVADCLADDGVVGWFRGAMEFGPRALGHRSILADPRSPTVKARLNHKVKERAGFRPFAPAVLAEAAADWFDLVGESPYMSRTAVLVRDTWTDVDPAAVPFDRAADTAWSTLPAVTHADRSARVQTVDRERNPDFYALLEAFVARTGCPMLLNTSFNGHDEPIVCTPSDALATHRRIGLDLLVLGSCLVPA